MLPIMPDEKWIIARPIRKSKLTQTAKLDREPDEPAGALKAANRVTVHLYLSLLKYQTVKIRHSKDCTDFLPLKTNVGC